MRATEVVQIAGPVLVVVLVGIAVAVETPTNALLSKTSGSLLWASWFSFVVGAVALTVALVVRRPALAPGWVAAPWYAWIGGVYGALLVVGSSWATPKLGVGTALVVVVASQIALGVALDHFGAFGLERHPASLLRLAGIVVVCAGAVLVGRG